jgi:hypothetical protein
MEEDTRTPAEVIAQYIKCRDYKKQISDEHNKKLDGVKLAMTKMEEWLLAYANREKLESLKSSEGTAYVETSDKYNVENWDLFMGFIATEIISLFNDHGMTVADPDVALEVLRTQGPWGFFKKDVPQGTIEQYRTELGELPPGIKFTKLKGVKVNRPRTKK